VKRSKTFAKFSREEETLYSARVAMRDQSAGQTMSDESDGAATASAKANEPSIPVLRYKPDYSINPRRLPPAESLKELTDEHKQIIELMVHGLDDGGEIDGKRFEAGEPLPFRDACRAVGARLRRMREMYATPLFQAALNREVAAQLGNRERDTR
jgi:hypothetical protein